MDQRNGKCPKANKYGASTGQVQDKYRTSCTQTTPMLKDWFNRVSGDRYNRVSGDRYNDIGDRYNDISMVCEDHAFFVLIILLFKVNSLSLQYRTNKMIQ